MCAYWYYNIRGESLKYKVKERFKNIRSFTLPLSSTAFASGRLAATKMLLAVLFSRFKHFSLVKAPVKWTEENNQKIKKKDVR